MNCPQTIRCYLTGTNARGTLDFGRKFANKVHVALVDWAFYSVDYVVNTSNNSFIITVGATPYLISINPGNYNASGLVSALNSFLAGALPGSSATYNLSTNTLTINHSSSFTITIASAASSLFGLVSTTVPSTTITGSYQMIAQNSLFYGLRMGNANLIGYDPKSFNWTIINNGGPGSLITRGPQQSPGICTLNGDCLSSVYFELLDSNGGVLNTGSETFMFVFEVYIDSYNI